MYTYLKTNFKQRRNTRLQPFDEEAVQRQVVPSGQLDESVQLEERQEDDVQAPVYQEGESERDPDLPERTHEQHVQQLRS